jgi:hypothetical protein
MLTFLSPHSHPPFIYVLHLTRRTPDSLLQNPNKIAFLPECERLR